MTPATELLPCSCHAIAAGSVRRTKAPSEQERRVHTYTVVTVLTAAWIGFSAFSLLRRADFVTQPLVEYGVPRTRRTALGAAKAIGSLGLLAGLIVPTIGIATLAIGAAA